MKSFWFFLPFLCSGALRRSAATDGTLRESQAPIMVLETRVNCETMVSLCWNWKVGVKEKKKKAREAVCDRWGTNSFGVLSKLLGCDRVVQAPVKNFVSSVLTINQDNERTRSTDEFPVRRR